jgi:hypothetical protein
MSIFVSVLSIFLSGEVEGKGEGKGKGKGKGKGEVMYFWTSNGLMFVKSIF